MNGRWPDLQASLAAQLQTVEADGAGPVADDGNHRFGQGTQVDPPEGTDTTDGQGQLKENWFPSMPVDNGQREATQCRPNSSHRESKFFPIV